MGQKLGRPLRDYSEQKVTSSDKMMKKTWLWRSECAFMRYQVLGQFHLFFWETNTHTHTKIRVEKWQSLSVFKNHKTIFYEDDKSESPFKNVISTSRSRHRGNMSHFISRPRAAAQQLVCHRSSFYDKYVIAISQKPTLPQQAGVTCFCIIWWLRYVCVLRQLTVKRISWISSETQ